MKHLALAAAVMMTGMAASAQLSVLKDAERAMKSKESFANVEAAVKPAMSDPETQKMAQTYYIPGKAAFNEYDEMIVKRQLGQIDEKGPVKMGNDLLSGYAYFMEALPYDSLPDAKGKVKPKYSKDIYNTLAGHYADYNNAAIDFWQAGDYAGAYKAWGILLDLPNNEAFAKAYTGAGRTFWADSIMSELAYNRALAAFQTEDYAASLASFYDAKNRGYAKKELYDYAIAAAERAKNNEEVINWAQMAMPIYGAQDDAYIRQIINQQLTEGRFDDALASINEAIATDPNNSQYQWVLGIIYNYRKDDLRHALAELDNVDPADPRKAEADKLHQQAKDAFTKAIELDPKNDSAYVAMGQLTFEDAQAADQLAPVGDDAYYNSNVVPLIRKSGEYYEQAVKVNPKNEDALKSLETIYYNLNDEANMERVKQMRLDL